MYHCLYHTSHQYRRPWLVRPPPPSSRHRRCRPLLVSTSSLELGWQSACHRHSAAIVILVGDAIALPRRGTRCRRLVAPAARGCIGELHCVVIVVIIGSGTPPFGAAPELGGAAAKWRECRENAPRSVGGVWERCNTNPGEQGPGGGGRRQGKQLS